MSALEKKFEEMYGRRAQTWRAPGRVNLIGEHTDYNDGFVLPAAIGFYTEVAVAPRHDRRLLIHSVDFDETLDLDLDALAPGGPPHWSKYVAGVAWVLEQEGHHLRGADLAIRGGVPIGAGLSSSAAIEVSTGLALLWASGLDIDRTRLALQCQRAENEFVGMRCGIMDQFISCHGREDHALMLDCRSLDFRLLPIPSSASLLIANTMVKHALTGGEYNERRADCEAAVRLLQARHPGIRALRDASLEQLDEPGLPDRIYRRCRHVVTENQRVQAAADDLRAGDLAAFGRRMAASHESLRDDYEVSCPQLDVLVTLATSVEGVYGARMTGGGFGGCTINLVKKESVDRLRDTLHNGYRDATGIVPQLYICTPAQGAGRV